MAAGESFTCNNNSVVTAFSKTAAGGGVYFIYNSNFSASGSSITETGNIISNIAVTGATQLWGINEQDGSSSASAPVKTITGNTFSNLSGGYTITVIQLNNEESVNFSSNNISSISAGGDVYGIYFSPTAGNGPHIISNNTLSSLTSAGVAIGMAIQPSNASASLTINGNSITGLSNSSIIFGVYGIDFSGTGTADISDNNISNCGGTGSGGSNTCTGMRIINGAAVNVYHNNIHTLSETGTLSSSSPVVTGLSVNGGTVVNVYNNFISDLQATNANLNDAVRGISITSGSANTSCNLYYNSIYLNASSSGANFGSSGVFHLTNAVATTSALTMIDNIIVNTSTPNGVSYTAAYRRSSSTMTNYGLSSDNNALYAGTPSSKRVLYYDGINIDQTITAFQTHVSPRETNSITVMPNFTSFTDLHLTAVNCQLDGRGIPVAGITTDIDGATRNATTPDIGADEFTATLNTSLAGVIGSAVCETRTVSVSGTSFSSNACDLIARVVPSGANAVSGKINTCVTLDASQQYFNAEPYVKRHFDIEPATSNTTTTSATITLYFDNAEFVNFNALNPTWPPLPTVAGGGSADPNRANLKVTQYHGTATTSPSTPGNYTANSGSGTLINPNDANIVWNGSYWAVTFDITGFSGFYVHSNPINPLPVSFNYLNGIKQGNDHLLTWSVTCNTTPHVTLTLERSADQRSFNNIYSVTADAVRCNQPFNYTDAHPLTGISYYRLKIVDADGKITYSNTIALINGTKGFALMNIAPNPVRGNSFKLNSTTATSVKMEMVISDMQGRTVSRQTVSLLAGFNSNDINVSMLAPGTYNIYGISNDDKSGLIRFVKQ